MNLKSILVAAAAISVLAGVGSAEAALLTNQNIDGGYEAGTGIPNGFFTQGTDGVYDTYLRARARFENPLASTNNTFGVDTGDNISLDFSLPGNIAGSLAKLTIYNSLNGLSAVFNPLLIPDNEFNVDLQAQNSESFHFGFIAGPMGGYNNLVNNTFLVKLMFDAPGAGGTVFNHIFVKQGTGNADYDIATAAVPEASTWALMIGGFGFAGAMLRSRRKVLVAA